MKSRHQIAALAVSSVSRTTLIVTGIPAMPSLPSGSSMLLTSHSRGTLGVGCCKRRSANSTFCDSRHHQSQALA